MLPGGNEIQVFDKNIDTTPAGQVGPDQDNKWAEQLQPTDLLVALRRHLGSDSGRSYMLLLAMAFN